MFVVRGPDGLLIGPFLTKQTAENWCKRRMTPEAWLVLALDNPMPLRDQPARWDVDDS